MRVKYKSVLVHVIYGLIDWEEYFVKDSDHRQVFEWL